MSENDQITLDPTDRRILHEVQRDLRRSPETLAQAAGTSVATLRRRLRRLRESGVIEREVAVLAPSHMRRDLGIEIIVQVTMLEEHSHTYDRFRRKVRDEPAITQCYSVTGDIDLILHVSMPSMGVYEKWIEEFILSEPSVKRCQSNVIYSRIKFDTAIPLLTPF